MENELTSLGTVLNYTGKKGKMMLKDRNVAGQKRIIVRLFNKAGKELRAICSEAVSTAIRAKTLAIGQLPTLELMENNDGLVFITMPQGTDITYNIEELDVRDYATQEVTMEDYLVL